MPSAAATPSNKPPPRSTLPSLSLGLTLALNLASSPLNAQEAEAFSPTTAVRVEVNAVTGALSFSGDAVDRGANTAVGAPLLNAWTVNLDSRLTLDTSFTGQDLLRLRLRSGNFAPSGFFSNPPTPLTRLDVAFQEPLCPRGEGGCGNHVSVNRLFLRVPLGATIRATAGSRLMQLDLLPVWPSVYTDSPILELFQRAGAPGAYSRRVGSGFGAWWQPKGALKGLSLAYGYVAPRGAEGEPARGGWHTAGGDDTNTVQLAYTRPSWNLTAAWTRNGQRALLRGTPLASQLAAEARGGAVQSWSLAGYWQPLMAGWIPAISGGWGEDRFAFTTDPVAGLTGVRTSSWSVGLSWSDAFGPGNSVMLALGVPAHVTGLRGLGEVSVNDSGLALEMATRIRLSDAFSITPAVFWLTRPRGAMGGTTSLQQALGPEARADDTSLGVWGGLLRGTLRF
ncbi:MAG: hypothetical protein VKO19_07915 [Cyanobacteriota bacterium]|nr:hypothetical protein [Cyanobacteriota bacterium]